MQVGEIIHFVIEDGIEDARHRFMGMADVNRRDGAISGFEQCRHKGSTQIDRLLEEAVMEFSLEGWDAGRGYVAARLDAIATVTDAMSAVMVALGRPPIMIPSRAGIDKVRNIFGLPAHAA